MEDLTEGLELHTSQLVGRSPDSTVLSRVTHRITIYMYQHQDNMSAIHCPHCLAKGVDCPLIVGGECTHCGRRVTPLSDRLADAAVQLRFIRDSITWRLRTARYGCHPRSDIGQVLARVWILVFISRRLSRL